MFPSLDRKIIIKGVEYSIMANVLVSYTNTIVSSDKYRQLLELSNDFHVELVGNYHLAITEYLFYFNDIYWHTKYKDNFITYTKANKLVEKYAIIKFTGMMVIVISDGTSEFKGRGRVIPLSQTKISLSNLNVRDLY